MKYEQMISDIYRVIGLLEGMTMMREISMTEAVACVLDECIDKLELTGAQLMAKDVKNDEREEDAHPFPEEFGENKEPTY